MAAVTADNTAFMQAKHQPLDGFQMDFNVAASTSLFRHTFVGLDSAGNLVSYVPYTQGALTSAATVPGTTFVGICLANVDNSAGSAGDKTASVMVTGMFQYAMSGATILDVGVPVYALDNATLSLTQTAADATVASYENVGVIAYVPATGTVVVDMGTPASRSGWHGGMKTVCRTVDLAGVINTGVWLLHPADQPRCFLFAANAVISEVGEGAGDNGEMTIVHTPGTDTALCGIITLAHAAPVADLAVVTRPGIMIGNSVVDADNMIHVAANVGICAKATTIMVTGTITGQMRVFATFIAT